MGVTLFWLIKVVFTFDCTRIAPHNNMWADVELSSSRTKNGPHEINEIFQLFQQTIYFCYLGIQ